MSRFLRVYPRSVDIRLPFGLVLCLAHMYDDGWMAYLRKEPWEPRS